MRYMVMDWLRLRTRVVILVVAGALILGGSAMFFSAWDQTYGSAQDKVRSSQEQLQDEWSSLGETPTPEPTVTAKSKPTKKPPAIVYNWRDGDAVMRISVPSLGQSWVVVEGTQPGDLLRAPGHFRGSAMPGAVGNLAVAGHRQPGMFWDLDLVRPGQTITVENRAGKVFTYRVTSNFITSPQSLPEVSPTPPGFKVGSKVLTLTTCNPKWDNYERLVVHAVMA